ncbi:unnamed protein product [Adineta ricciae]|uniref:WAP domain-containing protein n=1 Tax=Adineta ricciae TaxID=249248 RepID=A0A815RUB7_ADIRI|nr:unnamed protein product [Adineta ricciae]
MRYIVFLFALFAFVYLAESTIVYDANNCPTYPNIRCAFVCLNSTIQAMCSSGPKCCTDNNDCEDNQRCCLPRPCGCAKRCQNITSS